MLRGGRRYPSPEKVWALGLRIRRGSKGLCDLPVMRHSRAAVAPACTLSFRPMLQDRTFSTGTAKGLVKEQQSTTTSPIELKDGNILGSAAKEAQRLSALAAKCRLPSREEDDEETRHSMTAAAVESTIKTAAVEAAARSSSPSLLSPPTTTSLRRTVTEETLQNALEAAQALLFVTTRSSPLQDAIKNKQQADADIQKQISCLHRAFLAVTSWCLDVVAISHDKRILDKALEVAQRAHQLQLPFPIPLYQRLIVSVAQEYEPATATYNNSKNKTQNNSNTAGGLILEIASRTTYNLGPNAINSSHFFRDALIALAQRRRFQDVVTVLRGMESQCSIAELELDTLAHLLAVLKDKVEEDKVLSVDGKWSETADFMEILNMLNPYVWKTMSSYSTLSEMLEEQKAKQRELRRKRLNNNNNDGKEPERLLPVLPSHLAEAETEPKKARTNRRKRTVERYTKKDEMYFYRGLIYHNEESQHQSLPDITEQIEAFNDGKVFRYAERFERYLLNQILSEDDDCSIAGERMDGGFMENEEDMLLTDDELDFFEFSSDDDDEDDSGSDDDDDDSDLGAK